MKNNKIIKEVSTNTDITKTDDNPLLKAIKEYFKKEKEIQFVNYESQGDVVTLDLRFKFNENKVMAPNDPTMRTDARQQAYDVKRKLEEYLFKEFNISVLSIQGLILKTDTVEFEISFIYKNTGNFKVEYNESTKKETNLPLKGKRQKKGKDIWYTYDHLIKSDLPDKKELEIVNKAIEHDLGILRTKYSCKRVKGDTVPYIQIKSQVKEGETYLISGKKCLIEKIEGNIVEFKMEGKLRRAPITFFENYSVSSINGTLKDKLTLKEYFAKEEDSLAEALESMELLNDLEGESGFEEYLEDYADFINDDRWERLKAEYLPKVKEIFQRAKPYARRKLNAEQAKALDEVVYGGSDCYNDVDLYFEHMPSIFDNQYETISKIIDEFESKRIKKEGV